MSANKYRKIDSNANADKLTIKQEVTEDVEQTDDYSNINIKQEEVDIKIEYYLPLTDIRQAQSIVDIVNFFNRNGKDVIENLQNSGFLKRTSRCPLRSCRRQMRLYSAKNMSWKYTFRCMKCKNKSISVAKGTFFSQMHMNLSQLFQLMYCWANMMSAYSTHKLLNLRRATVTQHFTLIRDICSWKLLSNPCFYQFGGPNHVVQVDESAATNRKYRCLVKEQWVISLYDVTDKRRMVALVPDRSTSNVKEVLCKFILPGSEIWTDRWNGYSFLANFDGVSPYIHHVVDSTENFIDSVTRIHTNGMENYWSELQGFCECLGLSHSNLLQKHVDEFLWRREFGDQAFQNLLNHILERYPQDVSSKYMKIDVAAMYS